MGKVSIQETIINLSHLLEEVAAGREIVICEGEKPVARLMPVGNSPQRRRLGIFEGRLNIPDGFDQPLSDDEFP
jgi:antitoxin (DNA-binding transcriptional repressor) of toxin-antitoxin stability system